MFKFMKKDGKLKDTLLKVTSFIAELNDGIKENESKDKELVVKASSIQKQREVISKENEMAKKLIDKLS